ncbi:MAG: S8 family peptidase [Velocimicrobium sp.]
MNQRDSIIHVPIEKVDPCDLGTYPYHIFSSIFTLDSVIELEESGVSSVQRNPNLALFGSGVIVGIIDTGIDYQHKAFLNHDGTSRILSIWDQTLQDGIPPEGYTYGAEYNKAQINVALKTNDPLAIVPSVDENGHGTALASIAAGSEDLKNLFSGIVPSSELVIVKLKQAKQNIRDLFFVPDEAICYQESDLILAISYFHKMVNTMKRPIALCIGLGTSQGGHDGSGGTSSYLSWISHTPKLGIGIAAGNEGNKQRHYFGTVSADLYLDEFELKVSSKDKKFAFQIWAYVPSRLSIEIITPTGESTREIDASLDECRRFSFVRESSVVWVNNMIIEEETGDQMILIRMENPSEGIWRFRVVNMEQMVSSFHAWLPAGDLISTDTFFLQSSPDTTLTSPGTAVDPLTITAYNQMSDSILLESGRGYTRSNTIKPDIAAPGYKLTCAALNGEYGVATGTGAACAYATGIIAMILEWAVIRGNYTNITGMNISKLLLRGATREEGMVYPNKIWGYGKIDIAGLFEKLSI